MLCKHTRSHFYWTKHKEVAQFKDWSDPTKEFTHLYPHCFAIAFDDSAFPLMKDDIDAFVNEVEEWGHEHIGNYNQDWFRYGYKLYFAKDEHAVMFMMRWS
jgi:hypothetical protein